MSQPLEKCPRCGSPRTNQGQPSTRWFFECGSYHYITDPGLSHQTDLCEAMGEAQEAMDALESMAREHCHTAKVDRDYRGQIDGTFVTDSGAISTNATALEVLAQAGRFRIIASGGRMVVGYWPENDPEKKQNATPTEPKP